MSEFSWKDLVGLLALPALVALNGFFVTSEFALVAIRKTRVEEMVRLGLKKAKVLEGAINRLDRSIAATQLGVTLASIALGWIGEPALAHFIYPLFRFIPEPWTAVGIHSAATAIAYFLITFMHVVFGELIPKTMALQKPDRISLLIVVPLVIFTKLTRPLTLLMSGTANFIIGLFGFEPLKGEEMVHSVDELVLLIEDTEEAGILDADQATYVQNVFRLSNRLVRDCLVSCEKMATLEVNTPPEKVLEEVRKEAHTRMPVYDGNLDNIVGIVNTKDLFYLFSLQGMVVLQDAIYPPLFLKPDNTMAEALRLFRRSRRPMALVRTDEGKVCGLVTLEDVLEEIVGDIEDEHDRPTAKIKFKKKFLSPKASPTTPRPKIGPAK